MSDWVLSIDYGTSFTSAAIRENGRARLVRMHSPEGPRDVMPSGVFLREGGELVVGWVAENQAVLAPDRFEPTPKRLLGVDEHLLLGGEPVPVADAVAAVLRHVVAEARRSRDETAPSSVSLTHPASWAGGRVEALVDAARSADIDDPHLLSEPEGAALHFATERVGVGGLVAVYDLGGGTFDAAVLERVDEAAFRLRGRPGGRDALGGEEFDRKLYEFVAKQLAFEAPEQWARIRANARAHRDFRIEVRRAKEALSYSSAHDLYLPEADERTSWRVTREEFEELIRPDVEVSVEILARTLADAGIDDHADRSKLADVYLAGGSSRIPFVAQAIGERLGRVPRSLDEPKSVVALGATNAGGAVGVVARAPVPVEPPAAAPAEPVAVTEVLEAAAPMAAPATAVPSEAPAAASPEPAEAAPGTSRDRSPRADLLARALALAGGALVVVFILRATDSLQEIVEHPGAFAALGPGALATVLALGAVAYTRERLGLIVLAGFAVLALVQTRLALDFHGFEDPFVLGYGGLALMLLGGLITVRRRGIARARAPHWGRRSSLTALAGAALVAGAGVVAVNGDLEGFPPVPEWTYSVTAGVLVLLAAVRNGALSRLLAGALLCGLGVEALGYHIAMWRAFSDLDAVRPASVIGIAGGTLVLATGILQLRARPRDRPEAASAQVAA